MSEYNGFLSEPTTYRGRKIRYQSAEKVWVFSIRKNGKIERRVRNTLRSAKEMIDQNMQGLDV